MRRPVSFAALSFAAACNPSPASPASTHQAAAESPPVEQPPPKPPAAPKGMARIPAGPGPHKRTAIRYPFFIDTFETTVAQYRQCVAAGACTPAFNGKDSYETHCTAAKDDNLPINCVGIEQARAYCAWRGKRILDEYEWHWAARGHDRPSPWGGTIVDCQHANTSMTQKIRTGCVPGGGPWPVGHAPAGSTPEGVHDLLGNVAEHVEIGRLLGGYMRMAGSRAGGGWRGKIQSQDPLWYPFGGGGGPGGGRGTDTVGIRCGADAVLKPTPPPRMAFLHDGEPALVREVPLPIDTPFFLDLFEATTEEYAACVDSGACTPAHLSSDTHHCTADTQGPPKRPVNCITQPQAASFCHAQGKRLPTIAQWQWAMQSQEHKSNYPWGTSPPERCTVANAAAEPLGCGFGGPWPVVHGSFGDTFEGVHDMIGNVAEWTSSPGDQPDERLHAGRGWKATKDDLHFRLNENYVIIASLPTQSWSDQIGVRCAQDAPRAIE